MSAPTVPIPVPAKDAKKKEEKPAEDGKAKPADDTKEGEELVRVNIPHGTLEYSRYHSPTRTCN